MHAPASSTPDSLVDVLRYRAETQADDEAYRFLLTGEPTGPSTALTWGEVWTQARAIATRLEARGLRGERALLLYAPGMEYITAFLGCITAGVVAVPVYPPDPAALDRTLPRLLAIAEDCRPAALLSTRPLLGMTRALGSKLGMLTHIPHLATDRVDLGLARQWERPAPASSALAFLQYTSGSTGRPKGVRVTHANLVADEQHIALDFSTHRDIVTVGWLPLFHDMGLIGLVLGTLWAGGSAVLMSPLHFLARPMRWLKAISHYRGTTGGGPDFGYALCARKAKPQDLEGLDLSSWKVAFSGAEPVRASTMRRFSEVFAPCGFDPAAFHPCYGLAEATLLVTGTLGKGVPEAHHFDASALERGTLAAARSDAPSRELVSSGRIHLDTRLAIVSPEERTRVQDGQVGEIWLKGSIVADGYWDAPEATAQTFDAHLDGEGGWMRTGDLGCQVDGEIFITGRAKDLMIIRGRNHYPHDLETTVERAIPAIRPGCSAAFSVDVEDEERVVLVAELDTRRSPITPEQAAELARGEIAASHGLQLHAVAFIQPRSIPKTSSGKIQRFATRAAYLAGELEILEGGLHEEERAAVVSEAPVVREAPSARDLEAWMREQLSRHTRTPASTIPLDHPLAELGLDSRAMVELSADLSDHLGRQLEPTLLYDHPTLGGLLAALTGEAPQWLERREITGGDAIAIVGMACRYPGADDPEALWELLQQGADLIEEVPASRWSVDEWYSDDPEAPGKMYTREGGFLSRADLFDAGFFGISPREAERLDPQQRLLLEVSHEALERAGAAGESLPPRTGAYMGLRASGYERRLTGIDPWTGTGSAPSVATGRLAYSLGLRGPAVTVDTACSSSLVAVHMAAQALREGDCDLALAGGANLLLQPEDSVYFSKVQALSPTGRSRAFGAGADGYVRSEGVGVVALKRLEDALRDGDPIQAVIRGTALNHDGRSNGLTAPNGLAQQQVIRDALSRAGVAPADVGYLEAHGTGTELGDPIEVSSAAAVYGAERTEPLVLGSVKSNIGHTESAAGVAGLIKAALVLREGQIPATLHAEELNPHVSWDQLPLQVATTARPWPQDRPRIAAVSSFGFSGTNAHVVLEAAPSAEATPEDQPDIPVLVPLSARSAAAVEEHALRLAEALQAQPELSAADVATTLSLGRATHSWRRAIVAADRQELVSALLSGAPATQASRDHQVAFVYTGQGAQLARMGLELYGAFPVFRQALDHCGELLEAHLDRPLLEGLTDQELLDDTAWTQPAMFALQVALTTLWRSWGVEPAAVMGHSIGELAAAWAAGIFSLEDGVRLVAARGRLMSKLPAGGAMLAIRTSADEVLPHLGARTSLAGINGPAQTVASGPEAEILALAAHFEALGVQHKRLAVSHAFHSPLMEPMVGFFRHVVGSITYSAPQVPLISALSEDSDPATAEHWLRHVRQPVRYADAVQRMVRKSAGSWIEVGPHPVLLGMASASLPTRGGPQLVPSMRRGESEVGTLLRAAGQVFAAGASLSWAALAQTHGGRKSLLPTYPFQRASYWAGPLDEARASDQAAEAAPMFAQSPGMSARATASAQRPERARRVMEALDGDEAPAAIRDYLTDLVRQILRLPDDGEVVLDASLVEQGFDSLMVGELRATLSNELDLLVHVHELLASPSVEVLLEHLLEELRYNRSFLSTSRVEDMVETGKDSGEPKPPVFVFSTGRSGSTLFRVMLEGHSELFSPPSLYLLPFENARDANRFLKEQGLAMADGIIKGLSKQRGISEEVARATWEQWIEEAKPISEVYAELQASPNGERLVDKTPLYALDADVLRRAEKLYPNAQYIHLVRHPYSVIESHVRIRLHRLAGTEGDPVDLAAGIWRTWNQNILDALEDVPHERKLRVRFEDLVSDPAREMTRVCGFLGLRYEEGTIHPYRGERMSAGMTGHSLPIGDPNFHRHKEIDPAMGQAWRRIKLPRQLSQEARDLADFFGYELPHDTQEASQVDDTQAGTQLSGAIRGALAGHSDMVRLRTRGDRPPLFMVHPGTGAVDAFFELSRLLPKDQPIYAFRAQGLEPGETPRERVEEMAEAYLEQVRAVSPQGPYLLGGYSGGCAIAWEMARVLEDQGAEVAGVVLIEGLLLGAAGIKRVRLEPGDEVLRYAALSIGAELEWQGETEDKAWERVGELIKGHDYVTVAELKRRFTVAKSLADALEAYKPGHGVSAPVTLYRAQESSGFWWWRHEDVQQVMSKSWDYGWGDLTSGGTRVVEVPGTHLHVVRSPHVSTLARAISQTLEEWKA